MIILTPDAAGRFPDLDNATCAERVRNWLIKKLVGDKPVMMNVHFRTIPSPEGAYKISGFVRGLVTNCTFSCPTVVFSKNTRK